MPFASLCRVSLAIALLGASGLSTMGTPVVAEAAVSAGSPDTATPAQGTTVAALTGFRSAAFGSDEDAVRAAIKTDFGIEGDAVQVGLNTVERTRVMTVLVPDLLAEGGIAQVSYIFGYQGKTLIQAGILWSAATDPTITDAKLYANGDVLRAVLVSAGYLPQTISRDVVLENGILLFRGSDASGHTAILLLQGLFEEKDGQRTLLPANLTLLYAVSPDHPDILTIKKGDF